MSLSRSTRNIGQGILSADSLAGEALQKDGYTKFLDKLYLPCALEELSIDQILVINRYREEHIFDDGQFKHWRRMRTIFVKILQAANAKRVLELGCGKFPISDDLAVESYIGLEIDETAIAAGTTRGVSIIKPEACGSLDRDFDICLSVYAMHFHVEAMIISDLAAVLQDDAVIAFNVIGDNTQGALTAASHFSEEGYVARVFRGGALSGRETFFLMARPPGLARLGVMSQLLTDLLRE